jgi:hypothetical protein
MVPSLRRMMETAIAGIKSASFSIQIIRADGTIEDLGVVSEYKQDSEEE